MARADRLDPSEESFWRSLMRIVLWLPRRMDVELLEAAGITLNEYLTLMALSEAPAGELRMTGLAHTTALSASRMTRLVDDLQTRGLVLKRASADDRRGHVASVTPLGQARLEAARLVQLSCVRALVIDHVDPDSTVDAAEALSEIAEGLEGRR
jgi:DNA-binding MarR family transcriptional regulator